MNPEIQSALLEILKWVKEAKVFAVDQAPDVIQQMLAYGALRAYLGMAISGLSFIFLIGLMVYFVREWVYEEENPGPFITGFAAIVAFGLFIGFYLQYKKIQIAPKLYVINEISYILNPKK